MYYLLLLLHDGWRYTDYGTRLTYLPTYFITSYLVPPACYYLLVTPYYYYYYYRCLLTVTNLPTTTYY